MPQKDKNCVICGELRKSQLHPMCVECAPFLYKKGNSPHQKLRRRKVWLEKRTEILNKVGNKCEWCGNDQQSLAIHHPKGVNSRTYDHIWYKLLNDEINSYLSSNPEKSSWAEKYFMRETKKAIRSSINHYEQKAKKNMTKACPYCGGTNYIVRKTMTPTYRCYRCRKTFNELKPRPRKGINDKIESLKIQLEEGDASKMRISRYHRQKISGDFSGELLPKFYQKLKLEYEKKVSELLDEYLEMKDVKVLCLKCHNAIRLGLKICKKCKKNYHNSGYKTCFKCHQAEKEAKDPLARKIREIFGITKQEVWERNMEGECIICGAWDFEQDLSENNVFLIEKDGTLGEGIGELCKDCYEIYKKREGDSFIIKKCNPNSSI